MLGTIVNTSTIVLGGLLGSVLKRGLGEKYQQSLTAAMGFAATFLGVQTVVKNLGESAYPVLFIASLALGGVLGEALDLDGAFTRLVQRFSKSELSRGLSTGILLCCMGSLSILGPIQSALLGDHTFLFTNATLDFVTFMVLGAAYGPAICLAGAVLFCWQGAIYLGASALQGFFTGEVMCELSIVGGVLIAASGLSILNIRETKTLNLLPALLGPVLWFAGRGLLGLG
ncbi:MAG TPA: DUF554 domain-containing protein [Candidatus Fournierella merdigallinarum]|nr:DUF554 domain-containing protein [Candidatus Fournierella merdigallinarum]